MVFRVFLFTTKERLFRSIGKTSRKGPTKCVAKEKTEWNDQSWALFCGFWIINCDEDWHPTATNRIHSAFKQSTLKTGRLFRLHDISKSSAVCAPVDVILFIYFKKLFLSLTNSVYKELHGKHTQSAFVLYPYGSVNSKRTHPSRSFVESSPLPPARWSFAFLINCLFAGGEFVIVEFHTFYMQILKRNIAYLKNTSTQVTVIAEEFIEKL